MVVQELTDEDVNRIFRALADTTRRDIVRRTLVAEVKPVSLDEAVIRDFIRKQVLKRKLTDVITSLLDDTRRPSDQLLHAQVPGVVTRLTAELKTQTRMLEQFNDRLGVYARLPFNVIAP